MTASLSRRGPKARRRLAAIVVAAGSLICAATPAHADLEAVYAIPGPACSTANGQTLCSAKTEVSVLLPSDYAACAAEEAAVSTSLTSMEGCGAGPSSRDNLWIVLSWFTGSCASSLYTNIIYDTAGPGFTLGPGGNNSAPSTCSTIDFSYTQEFISDCPGTTFQVTADVRGNADGSYSNNYSVVGAGPCAALYDVVTVEGHS